MKIIKKRLAYVAAITILVFQVGCSSNGLGNGPSSISTVSLAVSVSSVSSSEGVINSSSVSEAMAKINSQADLDAKEPAQTDAKVNLDGWVGDYLFEYVFGTHYYYRYEISIYAEKDNYYATVNADGWQCGFMARASVEGNADKITLTAIDHIWWNLGSMEAGAKLVTFKKEGQDIHTEWLELFPPDDNMPKITFVKEALAPTWYYDPDAEPQLLLISPSPSNRSVAYIYTATNPLSNELYYMLTVLPKEEVFNMQPANAYISPEKFEIAWDPEEDSRWIGTDTLIVDLLGAPVHEELKCRRFVRTARVYFH